MAGSSVSRTILSSQSGDTDYRLMFDPWSRKIPWRRVWQPTPCLENPMGRGDWRATVQSIAELDVTERLRKTHICASFNLVLWQDPGMSHSGDRKVEG